jgi:signal transduction histidine kinase
MYDGARLYLIVIGMLPYLLLDRKQIWLLSLAIVPSFLSILLFDEIMSLAGVGYKQLGLVDSDYPAMWLRSLISYMACSSISFVFSSVVSTNDTINRKLIDKLSEKGKELSELNQNLEKIVEMKTQILRKQNEALSNYAFANSHELRGPVARILGLINVSKFDKELTFQWYVDKIEIEINEVDRLTKETSSRLALIDIEDEK